MVEEFVPVMEGWMKEEYTPVIENWCKNDLANAFQKWVVEEYTPTVEQYFTEKVQPAIMEATKADTQQLINESGSSKRNQILDVIAMLESTEIKKPTLGREAKKAAEPLYLEVCLRTSVLSTTSHPLRSRKLLLARPRSITSPRWMP